MYEIKVPDYFDEQRIRNDLARIADSPGVFDTYAARLRSRFTKKSQQAILDHYIALYKKGTEVVEARTEFERARNTYTQLEYEAEIKRKEKEVRLAELDADREEHITRKEEAVHKRQALRKTPPDDLAGKTEDERKMEEQKERYKKDIRFKVDLKAGAKPWTVAAAQQWRKEEYYQIKRDPTLTPDEMIAQLEAVDEAYDEILRDLKRDVSIYVDD